MDILNKLIDKLKKWWRRHKPHDFGQCSICMSAIGKPMWFKNEHGKYYKYMCMTCVQAFQQQCKDLSDDLDILLHTMEMEREREKDK